MEESITLRKAKQEDKFQLGHLIHLCLSANEKYALDPALSQDIAGVHWYGQGKISYLAFVNRQLAGSFCLEEQRPPIDSHIATALFLIEPGFLGSGLGKVMAEYAINEAYKLGFLAMEFKLVSNPSAKVAPVFFRLNHDGKTPLPATYTSL